jgi:hypothetical protein
MDAPTPAQISFYLGSAKNGGPEGLAVVQQFLEAYPNMVNVVNPEDGLSAIHYVSDKKQAVDIVKVLLAAGADPDLRTPAANSPLLLAAKQVPHSAEIILDALQQKYANNSLRLWRAITVKSPEPDNKSVLQLLENFPYAGFSSEEEKRKSETVKIRIQAAIARFQPTLDALNESAKQGTLGDTFSIEKWTERRDEMDELWEAITSPFKDRFDIEVVRAKLVRQERLARRTITVTPHL